MTDAFATPPRGAQSASTPMTPARLRSRHHEAVIEAEVRRLARTRIEGFVKGNTTELYGRPEEPPAA